MIEVRAPTNDHARLIARLARKSEGDVGSLAEALTRVLADDRLRERLAAGARERRERLPTWETAAAKMANVLEHL